MSSITIADPGLLTFIEDLGRNGFQRYGVSVSGVMDEYAARFANFLVGNTADAAVLEAVLKGPEFTFSDDTFFAVTGAVCPYTLNGQSVATWKTQRRPGLETP
jgi:antagonist of KipI